MLGRHQDAAGIGEPGGSTEPTGEGAGVTDAIMRQVDRRITIPMQQPVESLNVGVAAALVLYEAYRQRSNRSRNSQR